MNRKLLVCIASLGALSLPLTTFAADAYGVDAPPAKKKQHMDSAITAKVKAMLAKEKGVSAMHIKVSTDDQGVVTLSGTAKTKEESDKAASVAKSVDGVASVQNDIQVNPDR